MMTGEGPRATWRCCDGGRESAKIEGPRMAERGEAGEWKQAGEGKGAAAGEFKLSSGSGGRRVRL